MAARQLAHRAGLRALRAPRGGGRGGERAHGGRAPLSLRAASRALGAVSARPPVLCRPADYLVSCIPQRGRGDGLLACARSSGCSRTSTRSASSSIQRSRRGSMHRRRDMRIFDSRARPRTAEPARRSHRGRSRPVTRRRHRVTPRRPRASSSTKPLLRSSGCGAGHGAHAGALVRRAPTSRSSPAEVELERRPPRAIAEVDSRNESVLPRGLSFPRAGRAHEGSRRARQRIERKCADRGQSRPRRRPQRPHDA